MSKHLYFIGRYRQTEVTVPLNKVIFHVPFYPLPELDIGIENQYSDDYELTPFLQFTQAWRGYAGGA